MGVSKNRGTPKSSILMGFSFIKHPFWGPLFLETFIWIPELFFESNLHLLKGPLESPAKRILVFEKFQGFLLGIT